MARTLNEKVKVAIDLGYLIDTGKEEWETCPLTMDEIEVDEKTSDFEKAFALTNEFGVTARLDEYDFESQNGLHTFIFQGFPPSLMMILENCGVNIDEEAPEGIYFLVNISDMPEQFAKMLAKSGDLKLAKTGKCWKFYGSPDKVADFEKMYNEEN